MKKTALPLNEEPRRAPPPGGPATWMHNSVRGLLAMSLRSQKTTDSGPRLRMRLIRRICGDVAPMRPGLRHRQSGPLCISRCNRNGGRGDRMRLTVGAGCRCIHRISIWLTLYTCDDSRAQYLACNSLILREQHQNEIGHPFASSERNEASAQA